MNGIAPPDFFHADLLHPARRLWKRLLPSCSQGVIETSVLGLDRTGDTPGARAPDIWFSFLKTGETGPLRGICDHNLKDIFGLARLFTALERIAGNPLGSAYPYDLENLALWWRKLCGGTLLLADAVEAFRETGAALLAEAAARGRPRAAFALARDSFRLGRFEDARGHLASVSRSDATPVLKAAALRTLAIDAERRLRDPARALEYTEAALELEIGEALKESLFRRRERLLNRNISKTP
jgi:hypothetical protein